MADFAEPTKPCSECGGALKPEAVLCRHCGYVCGEPPLKLYQTSAAPTAEEGNQRPQPGSTLELMRFAMPMLVVLILVAVGILGFRAYSRTKSWDYAISRMHGSKKMCDRQFAEWLQREYKKSRITATVLAVGGECLINLADDDIQGLSRHVSMKLGAVMIAAVYAAAREAAGEPARAIVVFYTRGNLYSQTAFNGTKNSDVMQSARGVWQWRDAAMEQRLGLP